MASVPVVSPANRVDSDAWWDTAVELATAAISGDPDAAATLTSHARPWIFRLAARQFPFRGDAEDVTQNVCISVLQRVHKLQNPARLRSWLAAVTLNEVRNFYRTRSREAGRTAQLVHSRPMDGVAPERTSVIGGLRVDLLEALDGLPAHTAFALGMRQFGIGYPEIATEMSLDYRLEELFDGGRDRPIPEGTVKRWVMEARTVLRNKMSY